MRIFITGATGLVGRRLVADRLARGDDVTALSRSAERARQSLPAGVTVVEGNPAEPGDWQRAIDAQDAIVHLAGAGVADRRWTPSYKQALITSRTDSSHQIVEAVRAAASPPTVMVGASAVGWYADAGDHEIDEATPRNTGDFFGELCGAWEGAAVPIRDEGVRLVHLRIGLVLDPAGGVIARLAPLFRAFLGGPIGLGRAWMPWIHWSDIVGLADHALRTDGLNESINATSPEPVRNGTFSRALADALGRPCLMPVPPPVLRVVLGELGRYANASQRVMPRRALATGYTFRYGDLDTAMPSLFASGSGAVDPAGGPMPISKLAPGAGRAVPATIVDDPATAPRPRRLIRFVVLPLEYGLMDGASVSAGAVAACRSAMGSGCRVVIATGRPPRATRGAVEAAGVSPTVIACNGALIWSHVDGRAVHHDPLEVGTATEAIAAVRAASPDCLVGLERLDQWFTDRAAEADAVDHGTPDGIGPLARWLNEPVTQVDLLVPAREASAVRSALEPFVAARRLARFERPGGFFQLTAPRVDKAVALQRLVLGAGLDRDEVMAVGGGMHDAGMVEWAGFSVALADAPESVRRLADVVVPARGNGGLARALVRYVVTADRTAGD